MTEERRAVILEDIRTASCNGFLMGYVWGLREQGEMSDSAVALAVRDKLLAEGWTYQAYTPGRGQ